MAPEIVYLGAAAMALLVNPMTLKNCISKWTEFECESGETKAILKTETWTNCVCVSVDEDNDLLASPHLPGYGFPDHAMTLIKDDCVYNEDSITNDPGKLKTFMNLVPNTMQNAKMSWTLTTPDQTTFSQSFFKDLNIAQDKMYIAQDVIDEIEQDLQEIGEQLQCDHQPTVENISFKRAYKEHGAELEQSNDKLEVLKKFPNHEYFIGAFGDFCCMDEENSYTFCDGDVEPDSTIDRFVKNVADREEFLQRIFSDAEEFNECWNTTIEGTWDDWEKEAYINSGELQEHILNVGDTRNSWRTAVKAYEPTWKLTKCLVMGFAGLVLLLHILLWTIGPLSGITAVVLGFIGVFTSFFDGGATLGVAKTAGGVAAALMIAGKPIHASIIIPALAAAVTGPLDKHAVPFSKAATDGVLKFLKEHWHHGLQAASRRVTSTFKTLKDRLRSTKRVYKQDFDKASFDNAVQQLENQISQQNLPRRGKDQITNTKKRRAL